MDQRLGAGDDRRNDAPRSFVVIDLENLLHGKHRTLDPAAIGAQAAQILAAAHGRRPGDHLLVGCNPHLAFSAKDTFPSARLVVGRGADGADRALLDAIDDAVIDRQFSGLSIVSGDHAFAELAIRTRARGLPVRVVAPRHGLSAALRLAADVTAMISPPVVDDVRDLAA